MKPIAVCFSENLRRLRAERGFTQEEFAKKAGLSLSFLQNIEYGKKWTTPKTVKALANALRVSESELFRDCGESAEPDVKEILLFVARSFGIQLGDELKGSLTVRNPPYVYAALHEKMPHEIGMELTRLCQSKSWDWEKFRTRIAAR